MKNVQRPMVRLMAGILFLTTIITMAQAQTKVRIETPYGDMVVKL